MLKSDLKYDKRLGYGWRKMGRAQTNRQITGCFSKLRACAEMVWESGAQGDRLDTAR